MGPKPDATPSTAGLLAAVDGGLDAHPVLRFGERRRLVRRLSFATAAVCGAFGVWLAFEGRMAGTLLELVTSLVLVASGLHAERARSVDRAGMLLLLVAAGNTLVFAAAQGGLQALTAMWGGTIVVGASLLVGLRFSRALAITYAAALLVFAALHHQGVEFPTWGSTGSLWYLDRAVELVALVAAGAALSEGLHRTFARAIARERDDKRRIAEVGAQLAEVTRELEEARRAERPELASLSHDVRNLLGAARIELELLRESVPDAEEALDGALEAVQGATDLARAMVKPDSGVHARAAAVATQVLAAVAKVARSSSGRNAILEVDAPEGLMVAGPARDLERVLLNLALNALAAQPEGTPRVCLVAYPAPGAADVVLFDVADDGPGVPEELRPRLFERGVSGKGAGRGVGLAGARALTEAMGGTVSYVPREGPGALFRVALPRLPPDAEVGVP